MTLRWNTLIYRISWEDMIRWSSLSLSMPLVWGPSPWPLPHFELGVQNWLNQLCCNYFQLCWSLSPDYSRGEEGEDASPPYCELWIQNNGNQLCSNRAQLYCIFSQLYQPFFQLPGRGGGGSRNSDPPLRISGSKQRGSIVLQLCSIVLQFLLLVPFPLFMTQSLEIEFCGIVLAFFLKIAALSLEIRSWFLQKIVAGPKTSELRV